MMIHRSLVLTASVLASTTVPITPSSLPAQSAQATATDTSFQVARDAVIDITVRSGRLVVRGEDRSTAELRANSTDYQLRSTRVGVTLSVSSRGDREPNERRSAGRRSGEPDIELAIPRGVRLVIHGTSADVSVASVNGDVEVTLVSGDFEGRALGGRAIIQTMTGDVRVSEGVGDLRVTTVSGDVSASGVRGSVEVNATSGDITLAGDRLGRVEVDVVSGDINLTGALADDARLQLSSHSGDVTLHLPESAAGRLEVTTYNGSVRGGVMTMMPPVDRSFSADARTPARGSTNSAAAARPASSCPRSAATSRSSAVRAGARKNDAPETHAPACTHPSAFTIPSRSSPCCLRRHSPLACTAGPPAPRWRRSSSSRWPRPAPRTVTMTDSPTSRSAGRARSRPASASS